MQPLRHDSAVAAGQRPGAAWADVQNRAGAADVRSVSATGTLGVAGGGVDAPSPAAPRDIAVPALRPRLSRAAWLTLRSGGVLLWHAARTVVAVARAAPCTCEDPRWLLVPGYRLTGGGDMTRRYAARIDRAYLLWREARACGFVLSGAAPRHDARSEAEAALEHLADLGLPAGVELQLDRSARTTLENLHGARALLAGECGTVVVVSNRYHLARIGWLARAQGLDWRLCGAEADWRWRVSHLVPVLREALALLAVGGRDAAQADAARLLDAQGTQQ